MERSEAGIEIPFRGQIDVKVLRRVYGRFLTSNRFLQVLWILVAISMIWVVLLAPLVHGDPITLEGTWPIALYILFFAGVIVYSLYIAPRMVLQSSVLLRSPIVGEAKEAGVHMESEHSRSEIPWEAFLKRKIGKDMVLLYQSIQLTNVFPREFFASDADWQAFVDLVRRRVPEKAARDRGGRSWTLWLVVIWIVVFVIVIFLWNLFQR
jgi:hypothetical protein